MLYKTNNLLYQTKKREIKLAKSLVNLNGPKGLMCSFRPSSATGPAKFSTVALILDKIFLEHSVVAKDSDSFVYVKFEHEENVYEGICDGRKISWVGPEPNGYLILLPVVVYTLSNLFKHESEIAEELQGYFADIKANPGDPNPILLFCDAFYYGYAKRDENVSIESLPRSIQKDTIRRGIDSGYLKDIDLLSGLTSEIHKETTESEPADVEEEVDYTVKYDKWTEEQKKNIPSPDTLKTFVMTETAELIAKKVKFRMDRVIKRMEAGLTGAEAIGPDYVNILMVGRPATGKTALANAVAAMTGMPIYTIPFSKHTEEDTVEGKNKVVDGKIGFVETDFLKAYENGGIVVCEEINLADPGVVMGSMGQAIEKPFIVMKDGYIPVRRHPLCVVIGTMNTGTAGSKQLNQALSSRFKCTYTLDDPDERTFVKILNAQGYQKRACKYVYDAYSKILKYLKDPANSQEDLCENVTLRGCFGALENMEEGQDAKDAINNSLVGKIAEVDLEVAKQVRDNVIDNLRDVNW